MTRIQQLDLDQITGRSKMRLGNLRRDLGFVQLDRRAGCSDPTMTH